MFLLDNRACYDYFIGTQEESKKPMYVTEILVMVAHQLFSDHSRSFID